MANPVLELLRTRRSVGAAKLAPPGPTPGEIEQILTIAARVPDHKKLAPWRFILFEGDARGRFGQVLAEACRREEREPPSPDRLALEEGRLLRAPLVIGVVSRVVVNPAAPDWEQILSAGAACQNLTLAANAMGYGTNWITEWYSYSETVRQALALAANERIAGFVYIGTATEKPTDRERPVLDDIVSRWGRGMSESQHVL